VDSISRVQELLRRWDPIGVLPGEVAPADEYDSYAPSIVSLVAQGCSREQLCAHLETIRTRTIGLGPNHDRDWQTAGEIIGAIRGRAV
jgi:hypothetical protein